MGQARSSYALSPPHYRNPTDTRPALELCMEQNRQYQGVTPFGSNMEPSHRFIPDAGTRWVTLFVRLVHQLQKLCASSSALRDQLRGHIFFQLTQPDIGF